MGAMEMFGLDKARQKLGGTSSGDDPSAMYQNWDSFGYIDPRDKYSDALNWKQKAAEARAKGDEETARSYELTYGNMSQTEIDNLKRKAEGASTSDSIYDEVMKLSRSVLDGSYKLPENISNDITDSFKAIRGPVLGMIDGLDEIVKNTGKSMQDAITDYETKLKETGSNLFDEITTSVEKAKALHDEAIKTNREISNLDFNDISEDLTRKMAYQSAMLGRSSADPSFQQMLQKDLLNAKSKQDLQITAMDVEGRKALSTYEADKRLAVTERTGAGLENAALQRGEVARQTGEGLLSNQNQRVSLENDLGNKEQNLRWTMRSSLPASQLQAAGSTIEGINRYFYGMPAERLATAISPITGQQTQLMRDRFANTTTTTTSDPGWGNTFASAVGIGSNAASGIMTGIGAMNK